MADKTRADHDQLKQIAQAFQSESDANAQQLKALRSAVDTLRNGDWVGKAADTFYNETDRSVFPSLSRLIKALSSAAKVTREISQDVQRTEQEISDILKQDEQLDAGAGGQGGSSSGGEGGGGGGFWGGLWDGVKSIAGGAWEGLKQVGGFVEGFVLGAVDMVQGLWTLITTNPIDTAKNLWYAITHPGETWDAITKPFVDDWNSGNYGRAIGRGAFELVGLFAGGAGAVGKGGKVASIVDKASDAARIADKAADVAKIADKVGDVAAATDKIGDIARPADKAADVAKAAETVSDAAPVISKGDEAAKVVDKVDEVTAATDDVGDTTKAADKSGDAVRATDDVVRGVTRDEFVSSVKDFADPANAKFADEAYNLWKQERWPELEKLFNDNNFNNYGGVVYPPNNGAINVIKKTLDPGDFPGGELIIDRYGHTGGKYVAPADTPFGQRALPADKASEIPKRYRIDRPIPGVEEGNAIPWFGQPGNGIQYKLPEKLQYYIDEGYITPLD
jgi:WXG100 family type VII secretion target